MTETDNKNVNMEGISKTFLSVQALDNVDFTLVKGEIHALVGENGAGKSTLLKALFGLVDIREGTVTLDGEDVTNQATNQLVRKGVGFVPQTNNVFPSLTIEENLQMGLFLKPKELQSRVAEMWDLFPMLAERRRQRAGSLSGGERQSVAMARALMMDPKVLLLDEPSAGLSPVRQDETFIRTRQINRTGVTIIMV